jgi:hypothetical protein
MTTLPIQTVQDLTTSEAGIHSVDQEASQYLIPC